MKIILKKGKKTPGDKIIYIEANMEKISMIELSSMINQFALNEFLNIDEKENLTRENHFWFGNLIGKAIEDAKIGKDWFKLSLKELLLLKEYPFFIPERTIKKFVEERQ